MKYGYFTQRTVGLLLTSPVRDGEVAFSTPKRQNFNFKSCVQVAVSCNIYLAILRRISLQYVHKRSLKSHSFISYQGRWVVSNYTIAVCQACPTRFAADPAMHTDCHFMHTANYILRLMFRGPINTI